MSNFKIFYMSLQITSPPMQFTSMSKLMYIFHNCLYVYIYLFIYVTTRRDYFLNFNMLTRMVNWSHVAKALFPPIMP